MIALALLLSGCPRHGVETWSGPARDWATPPTTVTFVRVNDAGPFQLPDKPMKMTWSGPTVLDDLLVYDVVTQDLTLENPVVVERVRQFYGPAGYGYLGTLDEAGKLDAWQPPEIVLPPHPKVGDTWADVHRKSDRTIERSCEIMASNLCPGGIVSVCDSTMPDGRVILRDHFCPGIGWAGFEALVLKDGQPNVRMWSEDLARDGVAVGFDNGPK